MILQTRQGLNEKLFYIIVDALDKGIRTITFAWDRQSLSILFDDQTATHVIPDITFDDVRHLYKALRQEGQSIVLTERMNELTLRFNLNP